jgi:5-methyltetrahydrofolate corrinoid/iron sulfur protein methyltransferase
MIHELPRRASITVVMILVAENLTITNPEVARALRDRDGGPILRVVKLAERAGARYLDVNLGRGRQGGPEALEFVLDVLRGNWTGGLLVDTPEASLMDRAARVWPDSLVLNGFSGDEGRDGVLDVAAEHGTELVVFLMARGVPQSVEDRFALAADLVGRCAEKGITLDRVWIDPVVSPLGWADGQERNVALMEVLRRLPEVFGAPVKSIVGLSNLTTGATGTKRVPWMQEVFLAATAGAGLTHAMVDVRNSGVVRTAKALQVLEGERLYAPEEFSGLPAR